MDKPSSLHCGRHPQPDRRHFLQTLVSASISAWTLLPAQSAQAASAQQAWRSSYAPFDAPGFAGTLQADNLPMTGRPPQALRGRFYRNGPARFVRGPSQLQHWFDGDGMVQRFDIDGARVSHFARLLDTPKSQAEALAGRFLVNGFGSSVAGARPLRRPDDANVANINLLSLDKGRSLFALWEAGSALELDPQDLNSKGMKAWSSETAGAPFGAHPRVAPDGSVWNCGALAGSGKLLIYHLSANGQLLRQHLLDAPQADMVHDFAITERHLVFLLQPLRMVNGDATPNLLAAMRWDAQAPLLAAIVSQADFTVRWIELPNAGVFHIGNAWEQGDTLHLGFVAHSDILGTLRSFDVSTGPQARLHTTTRWVNLLINTRSGKATQVETPWTGVEFPRTDPRRSGQRTQLTVLLARGKALEGQALLGFNRVQLVQGERMQGFDFGPGWLAEEHVYVPHPERSDEASGWVLGTAYHWPSGRSTLSVFAAAHIADGPLAQWPLPYGLPLGLHGQFVAA